MGEKPRLDRNPSRRNEAFLEIPSLRQRIVAIRGRGAWRNGKPLSRETRLQAGSACVSLCSRAIRVLQRRHQDPFPGKIRLLGVASLHLGKIRLLRRRRDLKYHERRTAPVRCQECSKCPS